MQEPLVDPWVGKIPWRRERLPTPVFWPREFHRRYRLWGCKESDMTEQISLLLFTFHQGKWWAGRSKSWNQDAERNIRYLRYTDDTKQRTESKEKLRSPLMKLKEASEKLASTQDWRNQDHGIQSHHFMANRCGNNGNSHRLNFLGFQKYCRLWLKPWN